jgi:hypothetical protein
MSGDAPQRRRRQLRAARGAAPVLACLLAAAALAAASATSCGADEWAGTTSGGVSLCVPRGPAALTTTLLRLQWEPRARAPLHLDRSLPTIARSNDAGEAAANAGGDAPGAAWLPVGPAAAVWEMRGGAWGREVGLYFLPSGLAGAGE